MNLNSLVPEIKARVRKQKEECIKRWRQRQGWRIRSRNRLIFFLNLKDMRTRNKKGSPIEDRARA